MIQPYVTSSLEILGILEALIKCYHYTAAQPNLITNGALLINPEHTAAAPQSTWLSQNKTLAHCRARILSKLTQRRWQESLRKGHNTRTEKGDVANSAKKQNKRKTTKIKLKILEKLICHHIFIRLKTFRSSKNFTLEKIFEKNIFLM